MSDELIIIDLFYSKNNPKLTTEHQTEHYTEHIFPQNQPTLKTDNKSVR